jgi:hypothetical protein
LYIYLLICFKCSKKGLILLILTRSRTVPQRRYYTCWLKGGGESRESAKYHSKHGSVCGILEKKSGTTCSREKKVRIYKFCINGDDDGAGPHGEHTLRLNGQRYYPSSGYKSLREGQCHNLPDTPWREVGAWKTLDVGTEEHDDTSENDSTFAHLSPEDWYIDTCLGYELKMSRDFKSEKNYKACFEVGVKGVFQGYSTLAPMSGICRIDHVPSL